MIPDDGNNNVRFSPRPARGRIRLKLKKFGGGERSRDSWDNLLERIADCLIPPFSSPREIYSTTGGCKNIRLLDSEILRAGGIRRHVEAGRE